MNSYAMILYVLLAVAVAVWVVLSIQATPDVVELIEMQEDEPTQLFDQEIH